MIEDLDEVYAPSTSGRSAIHAVASARVPAKTRSMNSRTREKKKKKDLRRRDARDDVRRSTVPRQRGCDCKDWEDESENKSCAIHCSSRGVQDVAERGGVCVLTKVVEGKRTLD